LRALVTLLRRLALPAVVLFTLAALASACSSGNATKESPAGSVSIATVTPVVVQSPTSVPAGTQTPGVSAPTSGRWIDVDVSRYQVRLMDGAQALETISPVAVGEEVNTGAYESTQTGLYHVYNKIAGLQYDAPYDAYISDWVAFDPQKDNGFHSFLLDESGKVVDPSTGRVSNGCIRTASPKAIYDFAEVGMAVYVHL
jgi:hypothetical protein